MSPFAKFLTYTSVLISTSALNPAFTQTPSSIGIEGLAQSNSDFGLQGTAWLPVGYGFGLLMQGGFHDSKSFGAVGAAYRFMLSANVGMGLIAAFDVQEGSKSNVFYGSNVGVEVGFGPVTMRGNLYIPVGDRNKKVKNSAYNEGVFVNPNGTQTCSNPTSTDNRICDLVFRHHDDRREINNMRFDSSLEYDFTLPGVHITPAVGIYVQDNPGKNLVGFQGEIAAQISLGNGFHVTGSAGLTHDRIEKTDGVFKLGLSWQFGSTSSVTTPSFANKAPKLPARTNRITSRPGKFWDEDAILQDSTSNTPVQQVQFVDATNQNQVVTKVGAMPQNTMVVINGTVSVPGALAISLNNDHIAIVGGGARIQIRGATTGIQGILHVPGAAGRLIQPGNNDIFNILDNRRNVMLHGLFLDGNGTARSAAFINNNSDDMRLRDLVLDNFVTAGIIVDAKSDNIILNNLVINRGGNVAGISIGDKSNNSLIEHVRITNTQGDGIQISDSNLATINNAFVENSGDDGIGITNSTNVSVHNAIIHNAGNDGIEVFGTSNNIELTNIVVDQAGNHGIQLLASADNVTLKNIELLGGNLATKSGVMVQQGSLNITFENVVVSNWQNGFSLFSGVGPNMTSVADRGGNRFVSGATGQQACDGTGDSTGTLQVSVNGGGTETCQ